MQPDLLNIVFNKNHKVDSAALEVISGIRLVLIALAINIVLAVVAIGKFPNVNFMPEVLAQIPGLVIFGFWVISFGCGAYGSYSVVSALGWSGFIGFFFIASLLIPYLKLFALIFIVIKASGLISSSNYKFSLYGKVQKRA